jgi:Leu/Phe-tRNA-protein transferase
MRTEHLATLGAREIPRRQFVREVARLVKQKPDASAWTVASELLAS